jgi:hypothetical protein
MLEFVITVKYENTKVKEQTDKINNNILRNIY